jgi:ATP-dependent protease HslVU (ClpYQ) peptidase subunit
VTAIVAVRAADGFVALGGDSFYGDSKTVDLGAAPKVEAVGPIGFGVCGSVPAETAFRIALRKFVRKRITERAILEDLPALAYDEAERRHVCDEDRGSAGYMLVHDGAIYTVEGLDGIVRTARPYAAIGAGGPLALAAAAYPPDIMPNGYAASLVVRRALGVAADLSPWVRAPFHVITISGGK